MILFSYEPDKRFMQSLLSIINHNKSYFDGIMEDAYQYQLNREDDQTPLRIYLVGQLYTRADGKEVYKNNWAVVAINESDACNQYYTWTGKFGSIVDILVNNAGKVQVEPPR